MASALGPKGQQGLVFIMQLGEGLGVGTTCKFGSDQGSDTATEPAGCAPTTLRSSMMLVAALPFTPSCSCISSITQSVLARWRGGSWNLSHTAMLWRLSHPVLHSLALSHPGNWYIAIQFRVIDFFARGRSDVSCLQGCHVCSARGVCGRASESCCSGETGTRLPFAAMRHLSIEILLRTYTLHDILETGAGAPRLALRASVLHRQGRCVRVMGILNWANKYVNQRRRAAAVSIQLTNTRHKANKLATETIHATTTGFSVTRHESAGNGYPQRRAQQLQADRKRT